MSVQVGSSRNGASYNLPAALFCYHSQLFRQDIAYYKKTRAQIHANKKRKIATEERISPAQITIEDSECVTQTASLDDTGRAEDAAVVRLPDVDPFVFGLFLKYLYTGYYPTAVDARPETTRSIGRVTNSAQLDTSYTSARASMPPPAWRTRLIMSQYYPLFTPAYCPFSLVRPAFSTMQSATSTTVSASTLFLTQTSSTTFGQTIFHSRSSPRHLYASSSWTSWRCTGRQPPRTLLQSSRRFTSPGTKYWICIVISDMSSTQACRV